jgi:branched-chain amino acid transport system substrate-binding protein
MRTARHRDGGAGPRRGLTGSRTLRMAALAAVVALSTVACGNRSSDDKLNALLNGKNQGSGSAGAPATAQPSAGTPAAGGDSGTPAATPAAGTPAASAGAGAGTGPGTAAGSSAGSATRSAAGASGVATPGQKSTAAASPGSAGRAGEPSGSSGAAPGTPAPGAPSVPGTPAGCTGSEPPVVIGSVGTMSGVVGYLFAPGAKAVSAWAAEMNEKGGINCHTVKHLIGDSGGDPARYQALVRQFVEREGVIAFVFNPDSFAAQAGADYLEQKQVPVIGGGGGEMFTYDKSMQFPVFAMGVPMQMNQVFQASRVWIPGGKKKIGTVSCVEAEYCPIFDKTVKEFAPKFGFDLVYQSDVTITAPDYTANCLEARNNGVQAFITSLDGQTNQRLVNSCAKVGFNVPIAAASIQGTDDFKDNPNMVGSLIGMNVAPWFGNTPAVVEHRNIFKKHVHDAIFGPAAINGWTTAKAFEAATTGVPRSGAVSSRDVLNGLYGLNGNDLGGLTYPLRFSQSQPNKKKIVCGYPVQVAAKGRWDAPISQMACMPGFEP